MEYANGRLHMTEDDVSNFGASFCTAIKAMSDNVAELLNVLSATKDSDDLDVDDIAMSGKLTITEANANAIACGLAGETNPALKVNSATASSTTGVEVKSAAGDGGAFIAAISDKTNEQLNIDSKGSDTLVLQGTATGGITATRAVTCSSTLAAAGMTNSSTYVGTVANANGLTVGRQGSTNPALKVDTATSVCTTGVGITAAAGDAGVAIAAISDQTDEQLTIDAKGSDSLVLQGTATGVIQAASNVTVTDAKDIAVGTTTGTKIGTAVAQKIGLWDVTPVVQPLGSDQALVTTSVTTTATTTNLKTTIADVIVLLNAIRQDLIDIGAIKGSA